MSNGMTPKERLEALKRAQWRVKHQFSRCRICGGSSVVRHARDGRANLPVPYCRRHWTFLRGHEDLMAAAAIGERLAECDFHIALRGRFKAKRVSAGGMWLFEDGRRVHVLTAGYRLIHSDGGTVLGDFATLAALLTHIFDRSAVYSTRNRFAVKTLIM